MISIRRMAGFISLDVQMRTAPAGRPWVVPADYGVLVYAFQTEYKFRLRINADPGLVDGNNFETIDGCVDVY
jgi:hypothetical protein